MKAILCDNQELIWGDYPDPVAGPGEVVIRTAATAVNRADLVQRSGHYPPPPGASPILGLECSGVIERVGEGVPASRVGEKVCALLAGGGYAELVACPSVQTLPIPAGFSLEQAAAVPEVFTTAWLNLRREGELAPGEQVLLHAAASGVGSAALQLCASWGNPVFATVGSQAKEEFCRQLGAAATANRHDGPWLEAVKDWGRADVILDPVGAAYLEDNIQALRPRGRLINIGLLGGKTGPLPLGRLLTRRLTLRGSVLRSRSVEEKADILKALCLEVWPLLESGRVKPIIDRVFPIQQVQEAHHLVASNSTTGKVVLTV